MSLLAAASGVLTHVVFHCFYPAISTPFWFSICLQITLAVYPRFSGVPWHASNVASAFAVYFLSLSASIVAYRLSPFHPLARFPGPVLARVTKFWGAWHAYTGEQHRVRLRLHQKYGYFVRTGPDEISVVDIQAVTDVLGAAGVPKGEYYVSRQDPTVPNNILNTTGEEHDNRRRLWNRGMGLESLKEYESIIMRRGNELVERLKTESHANVPVDITQWIDYFSFDFMGDMAFGGGFNMVADGEDKRGLWDLLRRFTRKTAVVAHLPWLIRMLVRAPFLARDVRTFRQIGVDSATIRLNAGAEVKDLWYHLSDEGGFGKTRPPVRNVIAEGTLAMIAGSDTTASALASFWYFLLSHPDAHAQLREEVDKVYPPGSDPMDTTRHDDLVWLNACLNESMRLAPPFPTSGPRQVPYASQGATVAGRVIPPGTHIYVPPYVLQRDPRYFSPSPDEFIPSRWLSAPSPDGDAKDGSTMNPLAFIPFSYGPANCVGKQLARVEMRMVVSALMHHFDIAFAEGFDHTRWLEGWRDHVITSRAPLLVKLSERAEVV